MRVQQQLTSMVGKDEYMLGMGKGPKRTLQLVNYRLESRPLTYPRPQSLGLDLDLTQTGLDQATS